MTWWPEVGVGYYPVREDLEVYDACYWSRYRALAATPIGQALNAERIALVARHYDGPLVDIGIGSGAFIEGRGVANTSGFDVNPEAVTWLKAHGLFVNPRELESVNAASFWDSLEHIPDFHAIVNRVSQWVFVSIPIFRDGDHVLASKHFRRDEHVWYFTESGLVNTMATMGFDLREANDAETRAGREDIMSFAFRRRTSQNYSEWSL